MKKIVVVFCIVIVLMLSGCSQAMRENTPPSELDLPTGFTLVQEAGNGYFLYKSPVGYFLVSRQKQGDTVGDFFTANMFIDIVYIGKEL